MNHTDNPLIPQEAVYPYTASEPQMKDAFHQKAVSYFQSSFFLRDIYPTEHQAITDLACSKSKLKSYLPLINATLEKRGLDPISFLDYNRADPQNLPIQIDPNSPDPEFVLAADLRTNTLDKKSFNAKLKEIGMTPARFRALAMKPNNKVYFEALVQKTFQGADQSAKLALVQLVENGDLQAIKYYYELVGKYRPNQVAMVNFGLMIGRFMEVLSRHLNPNQIQVIAEEFDSIIDVTYRELQEERPEQWQLNQ